VAGSAGEKPLPKDMPLLATAAPAATHHHPELQADMQIEWPQHPAIIVHNIAHSSSSVLALFWQQFNLV